VRGSRLALALAGLLLCALGHAQSEDYQIPHNELTVALEPTSRALQATSDVIFEGGGVVELALAARFELESLLLDGQSIQPRASARGQMRRWRIELPAPGRHRLSVRYRGTLAELPELDHRETLTALPPMAGPRGSFLPGGTGWYPQVGEQPFTYRVRLSLPPGQRGLVPGRLVAEQADQRGYRAEFAFPHPAESIELMAGPYQIRERWIAIASRAPIRLRSWFHPEISALADGYLDDVERYIRLYDERIGDYPFAAFSVVSSPLPTGFGMPTLTYLGVDVLRLPFIRATSLGHEVLHNWWGNGVYVDYERGNWSEGLTTFMADYFYREQDGADAARTQRLEWLRDFSAVPSEQDFPLRLFTSRTHGSSQIVGYHKAAFVFFMLRDLIGVPAFDAGLRQFWAQHQFRRASWEDLRSSFERASGRDLSAFFQQWLDRTGAPDVRIEAARAFPQGDRFRAEVTVAQQPPPYALRVPLRVMASDTHTVEAVPISSPRDVARFDLVAKPRSVALDPQVRIFRRLEPAEAPPILRQVTLDPATALVIASTDPAVRDVAAQLAARLLEAQPRPDGTDGPLLLIGTDPDVERLLAARSLGGIPSEVAGHGSARVWASRQPNGFAFVVVSARDADALRALQRPLPHYGRQSWLVFDGSKASARGIWPGEVVAVPFSPQ